MNHVRLREFDNAWYQPGRSRLWQAAWFFLGMPVLRCPVLPSSGLRVRLLKIFGAQVGSGVVIKPGVRVKYPWQLKVGDDCWFGEDCWIDNLAKVELSRDVCLSQGAYLCTGNHDWSDPAFGLIIGPISLGAGSWVGARAVVAPGVTLGEHAVAAAGSVVTKSIPAWQIHAGNPAVFVRQRKLRGATDGALMPAPLKESSLYENPASQSISGPTQPRPASSLRISRGVSRRAAMKSTRSVPKGKATLLPIFLTRLPFTCTGCALRASCEARSAACSPTVRSFCPVSGAA